MSKMIYRDYPKFEKTVLVDQDVFEQFVNTVKGSNGTVPLWIFDRILGSPKSLLISIEEIASDSEDIFSSCQKTALETALNNYEAKKAKLILNLQTGINTPL